MKQADNEKKLQEKGTIVGNHLDFFRDLQRENYTTERGLLLEMDKLAEEKRVKLDAVRFYRNN